MLSLKLKLLDADYFVPKMAIVPCRVIREMLETPWLSQPIFSVLT